MSAKREDIFYTLPEYFGLEEASERRWEYRNGLVACMSGGSRRHGQIASNLIRHLGNRLAQTACRVFGSDIAVDVPAGQPYRYPDVSVACSPVFRRIRTLDALVNPVLIVEVLSPSSENYDLGEKFEEYQSIASFREYLLVAQDACRVIHRVKQDDGTWDERITQDPSDELHLASLDCELPLQAVYEMLEFPI